MKSLQKTIALRDPRYLAPTMTVETVRGILGMDEDEVASSVDDGQLIAWDIASDGAESGELRILTASVAGLAADEDSRPAPIPASEAIAIVLGEARTYRGSDLARLFTCSRTLIMIHVANGDLELVPGSQAPRRGHGGTPIITRASLERFLRARIEGGFFPTP